MISESINKKYKLIWYFKPIILLSYDKELSIKWK
jgi:hypothetical protein